MRKAACTITPSTTAGFIARLRDRCCVATTDRRASLTPSSRACSLTAPDRRRSTRSGFSISPAGPGWATTRQVRRTARRPLPSAPSTSASGWRRCTAPAYRRRAGRTDRHKAAVVHRGERPREILHRDKRHQFEGAGSGFRQHSGCFGAVPGSRDDGLDRKRRRRAQDCADIVLIGDLVEHGSTMPCSDSVSISGEGRGSASSATRPRR